MCKFVQNILEMNAISRRLFNKSTSYELLTILRSAFRRGYKRCQFMQVLNQMQQSLALTLDELQAGTQQRAQSCCHCRP